MRVLVLGASGMLGNAMVRVVSEKKDWQVFGTLRSEVAKRFFSPSVARNLRTNVDVYKHDDIVHVIGQIRPDVVINCIGLIKHQKGVNDPLSTILVNALLPHRLAELCVVAGARLVHISTDCVFSGVKGLYTEDDPADAIDGYGKSKFLGEVIGASAITLRTSIIGHELQSSYSLLEWFLSQEGKCKGFSRAFFSGLPTTVLAEIVRDVVIPRPDLSGLYHVGASPISKYDLLCLIARVYGKSIDIEPDDQFMIDRSLNSQRFSSATGYVAPAWPELIKSMYAHHQRTN